MGVPLIIFFKNLGVPPNHQIFRLRPPTYCFLLRCRKYTITHFFCFTHCLLYGIILVLRILRCNQQNPHNFLVERVWAINIDPFPVFHDFETLKNSSFKTFNAIFLCNKGVQNEKKKLTIMLHTSIKFIAKSLGMGGKMRDRLSENNKNYLIHFSPAFFPKIMYPTQSLRLINIDFLKSK